MMLMKILPGLFLLSCANSKLDRGIRTGYEFWNDNSIINTNQHENQKTYYDDSFGNYDYDDSWLANVKEYSGAGGTNDILDASPDQFFGLCLMAIAVSGIILLIGEKIESILIDKKHDKFHKIDEVIESVTNAVLPTPTCAGDLVYDKCHSACPRQCNMTEPGICAPVCNPGCECPHGLYRSEDRCYEKKDCPKQGSCCGKSGDRCENGVCKCGSREPCSGASDTCINGKCFCGGRPSCSLPASNRCQRGRCLCGVNFPCDPVGITPICLDDDLQIPSGFDSKASCKCLSTSCVSGKSGLNAFNTTTPFCGNEKSASDKDNPVPKGVCGKCQVFPNGGGGQSKCTDTTPKSCKSTSSCGEKLFCCSDGRCSHSEIACK